MQGSLKRRALGVLAAVALVSALWADLAAAPASAWTSQSPTSEDNPLANRQWFVDWERFGLAQEQFLRYLTGGDAERTDELVYGNRLDVTQYRGKARRDLNMQARREVGRDPYAWLPRVPAADREKARLILKMARNPQTMRFGRWTNNVASRIRLAMDHMEEVTPGGQAFVYIYRLQESTSTGQCGNHAAGGPRDWAAYRRWIRAAARGFANHRVAIFLEPDGLGFARCLTGRHKRVRYQLFRYAIKQLSRNPNATIYLDAGHSRWLKPRLKARMLRRAGVMNPRVRGFFLNSTGYHFTRNEVRHGNKLSRLLGGKHFVVATHINGNGPYRVKRRRYEREQRCNPPNRALGPEPTVQTASRFADAYVWIGIPGRSGGCRHRGQPKSPPANHWWEWYALQLARNAHWE